MIVELTHPFIWRCPDPAYLLNCNKVNTYLSKLETQAKRVSGVNGDIADKISKNIPLTEEEKEKVNALNSYKGDGFELLVEAMIKLFPCDKRIGPIEGYFIPPPPDVGVDGVGVCGFNNKPITIQCKYRQFDYVLTANADHLTNFTSASFMHYGVDQNPDPASGKCNLIIFTSGDSLNFFTDEKMFGHMVHAFCRKDFRELLDNNNLFWRYFAESWANSLEMAKN